MDFKFELEFYRESDGTAPVDTFLNDLTPSNTILRRQVLAGIDLLRDGRNHWPPDTEKIAGSDGLFVLRVRGANDVRIFYTYAPGRRVILLHAFKKKSERIPKRDLDKALEYKRRFDERRPARRPQQ